MPKAYASDSDLYAFELDQRKTELVGIVAETKWMVEFIALLAMNTAICTIFTVLMRQLLTTGATPRLVCGIIATFGLGWPLFNPTVRAVHICGEAFILKMRAFLRIPYDFQDRHLCLQATWNALLQMTYLMAIWGTSLMLDEMVKHSLVEH